jgi:hypothetical protein
VAQTLRVALYEQRARFVRHYVERVNGQALPAAPASTEAEPGLRALAAEAEGAKRDRMRAEAQRRLVVPLGVMAALAASGLALRASGLAPPAGLALGTLGGLLAASFYFALFRAAGLQYSFSAVNRDDALERFFLTNMALAVVAAALAAALSAGWLARRTGRPRSSDLARLAFLVSGVFCALLVLKMALAYWRHGVFLRWQMPDQFWAFGFYLDCLAVVAVGLTAPLMPLFAWAGTALARSLAVTAGYRRP